MPKLIVIRPSGAETLLDAESGKSLMEIMRDAGIEEILAICGGSCSCATCHIFIDGGPAELLPPMASDENDLLDSSLHRAANSRLSCQIRFSAELDSLCVRIPAES